MKPPAFSFHQRSLERCKRDLLTLARGRYLSELIHSVTLFRNKDVENN